MQEQIIPSAEEKKNGAKPVVELDPDFSAKEHAEFEKLEAEQPYKEIKEEVIRVPKREGTGTSTRNDPLFLIIFCTIAAVVLGFILYMTYFR
ncbi:MAG TPA: hypothetical protein O0X42_01950 [Methanocorpusculum sp.]|nr:hypothetical protein [Methanocorpusculum sp.]